MHISHPTLNTTILFIFHEVVLRILTQPYPEKYFIYIFLQDLVELIHPATIRKKSQFTLTTDPNPTLYTSQEHLNESS
jgi:hypothetical protein